MQSDGGDHDSNQGSVSQGHHVQKFFQSPSGNNFPLRDNNELRLLALLSTSTNVTDLKRGLAWTFKQLIEEREANSIERRKQDESIRRLESVLTDTQRKYMEVETLLVRFNERLQLQEKVWWPEMLQEGCAIHGPEYINVNVSGSNVRNSPHPGGSSANVRNSPHQGGSGANVRNSPHQGSGGSFAGSWFSSLFSGAGNLPGGPQCTAPEMNEKETEFRVR